MNSQLDRLSVLLLMMIRPFFRFQTASIATILLLTFFDLCAGQGWWQPRQARPHAQPAQPAASEGSTTNSNFTILSDNSPLPKRGGEVNSYAPVIERVGPTIVTITTRESVRRNPAFRSPLLEDPFFRRFFGIPEDGGPPQQREGLGSGVVVSSDGFIITNNHVIEGAQQISVTFGEEQDEYPARVVGRDERTDLAIIKIERMGLPAATFADSDQVKVGDVVLAIGNPFRLGRTVTKGIVSAIGRDVPLPTRSGNTLITDFIQTDASINPGNSGGALIDSEGRVVGINTAIFTPSGGNVGIGFAIPSNVVKNIAEQLVRTGSVSRGLLGILLQPISADMAEALGLPARRGALVGNVNRGSAAEKAGIKEGDVIIEFQDTPVRDSRHLQQLVAAQPPGTTVRIKVLRDGRERTLNARLDDMNSLDTAAVQNGSEQPGEVRGGVGRIAGMEITTLDRRMAEQLGLPRGTTGVTVVSIEQGSSAEQAGLQTGDVILVANGRAIARPEDLISIANNSDRNAIMIRVARGGQQFFVALRVR